MATTKFEIAFPETVIKPVNVSSSDLGDLISEVETAVALVTGEMHEEIDAEKVHVGLIGVNEDAVEYTFGSDSPDIHSAVDLLINSLKTRSYQSIPVRAIRSLKEIDTFRHRLNAGLRWERPEGGLSAAIKRVEDFSLPEIEIMSGETVIYGNLTRVGGTPPKLRLRLQDGTPLSVLTTESIAKDAGAWLYEDIGLRGRAEWAIQSSTVISFRAEELLPFRGKLPNEVIKRLREATANLPSSWDTLQTTEELMRELRD